MPLLQVAVTVPEVAVGKSDTPVIPVGTTDLLDAHRTASRPDERCADAIMHRRESADLRSHSSAVADAPGLGFCGGEQHSRECHHHEDGEQYSHRRILSI